MIPEVRLFASAWRSWRFPTCAISTAPAPATRSITVPKDSPRPQAASAVVIHHDEFPDRSDLFAPRPRSPCRSEGLRPSSVPTKVTGVSRPLAVRPRIADRPRGGSARVDTARSLNWIRPDAAPSCSAEGPLFDRKLVQLVDVDFYRRVLAHRPRAAMLDALLCRLISAITAREITALYRSPASGARGDPLASPKARSFRSTRAVLGLRAWTR